VEIVQHRAFWPISSKLYNSLNSSGLGEGHGPACFLPIILSNQKTTNMKMKLMTTILFSLLAAGLFAQPTIRFGLKGGLNIATIVKTNDDNFQSDPLFGFNGGALLQIPFGNIVAIQPELLYSQKGYKSTGTTLGQEYDYRRHTNFVDVPLLLRLNASENFGFVIGPQFSFLTSTRTVVKSGDNSMEQTVDNDNSNLRKNILGGVIGFDVNLDHHAFVYARYTLDLQNDNGNGSPTTPAYKNQVFQLGLGVLF
jgi:hypothetical protein